MISFDENKIDCSKNKKIKQIIEHPNFLQCFAIFKAIDKIYMLFEFAYFPFFNFYRNEYEKIYQFTPNYLAQLIISLEFIQCNYNHDENYENFCFSPDRIFIGQNGKIKILSMIDWKKSEIASNDFQQLGLKYSSMLYCSPEQLRGQPICFDDILWSFSIFAFQILVGQDPYENERVESILKLNNPNFSFKIPPFLHVDAQDLLSKLLCIDKSLRLIDIDKIKQHSYFKNINWNSIFNNSSFPLPSDNNNFLQNIVKLSTNDDNNNHSFSNDQRYSSLSVSTNATIKDGQPLDTLIAPALKNDWAGFTLRNPNADT